MELIFVIGALLIVAAFCVSIIAYLTCCKVAQKTTDTKDALKLSEIRSRYRLQKWRKLKYLADYGENVEIQKLSKRALRLEVVFFILFTMGAALMSLSVKSLI